MKIIRKSNFDLDTYTEVLILENVPDYCIDCLIKALNDKFSGDNHPDYYCKVEDDYKLWLGMADLV